jgi:Holliday junction DNA helicase RuvA
MDEDAQAMFEALCKVNRVGPSVALSLLRLYTPGQVVAYVRAGDSTQLAKAPGLGKKTAELICSMVVLPGQVAADAEATSLEVEVTATLSDLGFDEAAARKVVHELIETGVNDEASLLREAMSVLRSHS